MCGQADDLGGSMCDGGKFVFVGDGHHGEEAEKTVQQDELN